MKSGNFSETLIDFVLKLSTKGQDDKMLLLTSKFFSPHPPPLAPRDYVPPASGYIHV